MTEKYKTYLESKEWQDLKIDLIQRRGCKCEKCKKQKSAERLQVHHLTYKNIYKESAADLVVLCAKCHMLEHKDKVPKATLKKYGIKPKGKKKKSKATKKDKVDMLLKSYQSGKITASKFGESYRKINKL